MSVFTNASVGTSLADIGILPLRGKSEFLNFEVAPVGATLAGFVLQLQDESSGEFYDYLADTDFDASGNSNMLFASTTGPHEVADGGKAHATVRTNGAYAAKFRARTTAGTAAVTVRTTPEGG